MPLSFIPLYATLALSLSALFAVPLIAIPAFADSADTIQLGFLDSIDDPSRPFATPSKAQALSPYIETAETSGPWQRGLGPVWMWLPPPPDRPAPAVIASR